MGLFSRKTPLPAVPKANEGGSSTETPTRLRRRELDTLLDDVGSAREYQTGLLPPKVPKVEGYDLEFYFSPARQLSGDFYDFQLHQNGSLGITIADASGKGITAGLLAVTCRALLRAQPDTDSAPKQLLSNVNRMLQGSVKRGMFVSAIHAVLDPAAHTIVAANAGHNPMIVWHARSKIATDHSSKGPVLGVLPNDAYEAAMGEETIELQPGDRFVLITDGVNEAMAPGEREFGMEHLRRRLHIDSNRSSEIFLRNLTQQIEIHRGGGEQSDDITLITGRRLP